MCDVRWLTATGTELARRAVSEIRELTSSARERAKILEQNPKRVPIPGYQWADHMSSSEVENMLGFQSWDSLRHISRERLPRHRENGHFFYLAGEVEASLLSERVERLWTLDRKDGTHQLLSETLFIAYARSFHAAHQINPLLVEPMSDSDLRVFITEQGRAKSAFERFNICEENGDFCRITSHQFRHWLNDLADCHLT
jgi:hypothetical protein